MYHKGKLSAYTIRKGKIIIIIIIKIQEGLLGKYLKLYSTLKPKSVAIWDYRRKKSSISPCKRCEASESFQSYKTMAVLSGGNTTVPGVPV